MRQKSSARDFGWRLHGQVVTLLPDRSFDLAAGRPGRSFLEPYCPDVATLQGCLQCGACTATCGVADNESLFPRRQMTFVQLGLEDHLVVDRDIWNCYGCNECSTRCPSGVRPGRIMGALRHLATERFAYPRAAARIVNSPRLFWLAYAAAAALLAALVATTGAFAPAAGPLRYDGMLPHGPLIAFFAGFTAVALVAATIGATRAWSGWYGSGSSPLAAGPRVLAGAVAQAAAEILRHRKFSDCEERGRWAWAHLAVLAGFLGLLGLAGVVAIRLPLGMPYPLSIGDPLKVLGNVFAALLVGGASCYLVARVVDAARGQASPFFDWAFPSNVLLVGLTGIAAEILRIGDARDVAYPVYFAHLVLVLVLIVTLPYTKLAHATYRLLAVAGRKVDEIQAQERARDGHAAVHGSGKGARGSAGITVPSSPKASVIDPEVLVGLGHEALAAYSDAELVAAYYGLRDEEAARGDERYYPNLRRIFGTAFEREKDRREARALVQGAEQPEVQAWYQDAASRSCTWWLGNHLVARHALTTCMACGMCTSVCPAAEHHEEYDPREIVDAALSGDEDRLVGLLQSEVLWYCAQCGSCTGRCPRENDIMSLVGSLRCLAQLKGYHLDSVRGRQQYAGRHLWGANLWNRACSLYFRNAKADHFPDFGPRFARWVADQDGEYHRVGGNPDMDGTFAGRKVPPATLNELRNCIRAGGALYLWDRIEEHAEAQASEMGLDLDQYHEKVRTEG